jgi:hypothetical protein
MQTSTSENWRSPPRVIASPPVADLEPTLARPIPTSAESSTTIDLPPTAPLLPPSMVANLGEMDLWLIGTDEQVTPASNSPPTTNAAGATGVGALAAIAPTSQSNARPATFDPVGTPDRDTSITSRSDEPATPSAPIAPSVNGTSAAPAPGSRDDRVSIRSALGNETFTLDANGDRLENVYRTEPPVGHAQDFALPYGLFGFEVTNVEPGGIAKVDLTLPKDAVVNGYYKQDPGTQALSRFDFDGQTGAVVRGNTVTVYLRDGGRGDDDGIVNGEVVDPGGPGYDFPVVTSAFVREVTFSGPDLITIEADPGTPAYPSPPHWLDTDANGLIDLPADHALPVGYPRDTDAVVSAKFATTISNWPYPPPNYSLMVRGYNTLTAAQPYDFTVPPTAVSLQGSDLYLPPTTISNPFPGTVNYGMLTLFWEFSNNNGLTWAPAGRSENELYVTLDKPEPGPVWHTPLHIGMPGSALLAAATAAVVITETMKAFETRAVTTRNINPELNAKPLTYYKQWDTTNATAGAILADPKFDGQCQAFAELFILALRKKGVKPATTPMNLILVVPKLNTEAGFLVNNWDFAGAGTSGNAAYPYVNELSDPAKPDDLYRQNAQTHEWEYYWGAKAEVTDKDGMPGQNTTNPKSGFQNHVLVEAVDKVFDPSYGKSYDNLQKWEDASVAGFVFKDLVAANNTRLLFRKNPAGEDIVVNTRVPG